MFVEKTKMTKKTKKTKRQGFRSILQIIFIFSFIYRLYTNPLSFCHFVILSFCHFVIPCLVVCLV